jgi:hypothetical protein
MEPAKNQPVALPAGEEQSRATRLRRQMEVLEKSAQGYAGARPLANLPAHDDVVFSDRDTRRENDPRWNPIQLALPNP